MGRTVVPAVMALAVLLACAAPSLGGQRSAAVPSGAAALVDFNGDGFDDLAVGAPGETVGTAREAGAVVVLRGVAESGPPSAAQQFT